MNKRFLNLTLACLFMFTIILTAGCGKESSDPGPTPDPGPDIEKRDGGMPFSSISFPNEGGSFACTVHGMEGNDWSVESNLSWCSVSSQNNILKIDVAPNNISGNRSAKITVTRGDKTTAGIMYVMQGAATSVSIQAQTSTKNTFFPIFSATWCKFCPEMDKLLSGLQKRWDYPILPMRIHVKDSDLYTSLSEELSEIYDNDAVPTGYFENFIKIGLTDNEMLSLDNAWNTILWKTSEIDSYSMSCSTINCRTKMSDTSVEAAITIKPAKDGDYRLKAYILEDNINCRQVSESEGLISDYTYDGVLIGALTPVAGELLKMTNVPREITLKGAVPSDANLSNLRLLLVIERYEPLLNYSDKCWYADNCLSIPIGTVNGEGNTENIYIGDDIEN